MILLVLASIHVNAQDDDDTNAGMCPVTPRLGDKPIRKYWLHGTIGGKASRMYLERDSNVVIAAFYYRESTWKPTILGGHWNNGKPTASDKTELDPATGQLTGKLTTRGFAGSWTPVGRSPALPIRLVFEPRPSCSALGHLKRFNDPNWPITFSYPAAMQLSQTDEGLTLTCPDPAGMFYDFSIWIRQGPLSKIDHEGFHLTGGKWMRDPTPFSHCADEANGPPGCKEAAVVSHQGPITILDNSEHEWRDYCTGGGYVAQGVGSEKMLVIGDKWVDIRGTEDYEDIALGITATAKIRWAE